MVIMKLVKWDRDNTHQEQLKSILYDLMYKTLTSLVVSIGAAMTISLIYAELFKA